MLEFIEIIILFFMQTHEKETQLGNYALCAKSASLISNMSVNHYPVPLSAADVISSAGPRVGPGRDPPKRL